MTVTREQLLNDPMGGARPLPGSRWEGLAKAAESAARLEDPALVRAVDELDCDELAWALYATAWPHLQATCQLAYWAAWGLLRLGPVQVRQAACCARATGPETAFPGKVFSLRRFHACASQARRYLNRAPGDPLR
jgi:hypothetical protein